MEEVRIRLIYPAGMEKGKVAAAFAGLERLRPLGVVCEKGDSTEPAWDVRASKRLKKVVDLRGPAVIGRYPLEENIAGLAFDAEVIGVGITEQPLLIGDGDHRGGTLDVAEKKIGALVSLAGFDFRPVLGPAYRTQARPIEGDMVLNAIELAVARAAGRVLLPYSDRLRGGTCHSSSCIMQECRSSIELMEKLSRVRLDICLPCKTDITSTVGLLQRDY